MSPEILTIAVAYRDDREAAVFLSGWARLEERGHVVLVRNGTDGELPEGLRAFEGRPDVTIASSPENLGYFGGARRALQQHVARAGWPSWIAVCNVDVAFPDAGIFEKLEMFHGTEPPAVVGPDIQLESDRFLVSTRFRQNPALLDRPSSRRMRIYRWLFKLPPLHGLIELFSGVRYGVLHRMDRRGRGVSSGEKCAPAEVYAVFGAFMLFSRRFFEAGGTLDFGGFLYGEEIFVAEVSRRQGLKTLYDPRLRVIHREHSAMSRVRSLQRAHYVAESYDYLYRTFFAAGRSDSESSGNG